MKRRKIKPLGSLFSVNSPEIVYEQKATIKSNNRINKAANLPKLTKFWIRVAAVNSAGQGGFSDPASVYVNG